MDREVEIPTDPQRIIVLGNFGEVTALGIKPVGTLGYYIDKYGAERTAGAENVGQDVADLEKVLALKPDLIIIPSYFKPEELEGLSKIAPTIDWRQGDAQALPIAAGESFHVVICQQGLQFVPDKSQAVREMHRALRSGGRLAVATWRGVEQCRAEL